jgi:anti-anti-sigma factor
MTMTENRSAADGLKLDTHPDLKLTVETIGDRESVVIRLAGLIDTYNSDFFRTQVIKVLDSGRRNLIIDASATTFMSSTGIGAFTALLKHVRQNQGTMIIVGMPAKIYEVFRLLGFTSFFQFCSSRDEAMNLLKVKHESTSVFPKFISCPICRRSLKAVRAGRFRCPTCRVVLAVNDGGEVFLG